MKNSVVISLIFSLILGTFSSILSRNQKSIMAADIDVDHRGANGQIIQIIGEVKIERKSGRIARLNNGTRIYPGDKLLTAKNAQIMIQCADLTIQSVAAKQSQLNNCALANKKSKCPSEIIDCPHRGDELAWNNPSIPYIISPRRTTLPKNEPILLRWNDIADSYIVQVTGKGVDWETEVNSNEIVYPNNPPLKSGIYYSLIVETDTGRFSLEEKTSKLGFKILDQDTQNQVDSQIEKLLNKEGLTDEGKALSEAYIYAKYDLKTKAIATLEEAINSGVKTTPIYRQLGELYREIALSSTL